MAAIYNFPEILKGDTFKKRILTITNGVAEPLDLTDFQACFLITDKTKKNILFKAPVAITDPLLGEITLQKWNVNLEAYNYQYEIKITDAEGNILTYLVGELPVKSSLVC